nr:DNA adenine methylase [Candidatus Aminicenantes bacterium]NIM80994.1 DNA adenine methylase [Candidatus Aminicenantes bacterium]NIN20373.1 DNA adenine methylase [Candidatus Aminicenantes bacterium]NIN44146.1 DNA adenine methylase [Candidatus Aminicenantes bacterium]NIN86964.1 DNA adenine methylase [Candidatus Aminicenantes bacterium]
DDALKVIKRYDSSNTLFYCDPPYPHGSRGDANAYQYEMSDQEHIKLVQRLNQVSGRVALSGYRCDLMDELYKGWKVHAAKTKKALSVKSDRTEILWTNY